MINEYQRKVINNLPKERKDFVEKQLTVFDSWMKGDMFMPNNGYCYYCKYDIIKHELEKGNDGSKGVTGCPNCCKSFCD